MSHFNTPVLSTALALKHFRVGESAHGLRDLIVNYLAGLLAPQTLILTRCAGSGAGASWLLQLGTTNAAVPDGPAAGVVDCAFRVTADAAPAFDALTAQMLAEIAARHPAVGTTFEVWETICVGAGDGTCFLVGLIVEVVPPPPP